MDRVSPELPRTRERNIDVELDIESPIQGGLPASCGARLGAPGRDRRLREPDRQAPALAQGGVIRRPIGDPMSLFGNAVPAFSIDLEGHGRSAAPGGSGPPTPPASRRQPTD